MSEPPTQNLSVIKSFGAEEAQHVIALEALAAKATHTVIARLARSLLLLLLPASRAVTARSVPMH